VDNYLQFVGARGRPSTWLATAYNLLDFYSVIPKHQADVITAETCSLPASSTNRERALISD
jgi:hypothetical protein